MGMNLLADRINWTWWWSRCGQEGEIQDWVQVPGLNCYIAWGTCAEQCEERPDLEMKLIVACWLWGPFETYKKAVRCLEYGDRMGIGADHVNLGIMPWGWSSRLTTKHSWPLFTLNFMSVKRARGTGSNCPMCASLTEPPSVSVHITSLFWWRLVPMNIRNGLGGGSGGTSSCRRKESMRRRCALSCPAYIRINYHRVTLSMIFGVLSQLHPSPPI